MSLCEYSEKNKKFRFLPVLKLILKNKFFSSFGGGGEFESSLNQYFFNKFLFYDNLIPFSQTFRIPFTRLIHNLFWSIFFVLFRLFYCCFNFLLLFLGLNIVYVEIDKQKKWSSERYFTRHPNTWTPIKKVLNRAQL